MNLIGCGVYSFSGTSIPEGAKTFCVHYIKNAATLVQPNLSNNLTEELKTKCLNETDLIWEDNNADISFSGTIKSYTIKPMSIQNNETAAQNRLTVMVEITCNNRIDESQSFKRSFTQYADFDSNKNLSELEDELNNIIIENLIDDIFNTALVNW
tara:strand:+ start:596 stop:1060 length:465 start_codon:yes stop_codon:yes gene_type:complete